jgi:hypothetical protein
VWAQGLDPDGTERIVVVVKGTFDMPASGGVLSLAEEQLDFVHADTFTGEPGESATLYETDFAPIKPHCDVLLIGAASAPYGQPVTSLQVGMRVGDLVKQFEVIGDRYWTSGLGDPRPSSPRPFTRIPLTYDRAFGGGAPSPRDPSLKNAFLANPVGIGYFEGSPESEILGQPVPNTQDPSDPVVSPRRSYQPMAFGPIGRNFAARVPLAGTYDEHWLQEVCPFLPADFDNRYYQSAPVDQQMRYPSGGEIVQLVNLTATPLPPCQLPDLGLPVEITHVEGQRNERAAVVDTIVLEPDAARVTIIWRTSQPLRRNIREIAQVVVGRMPQNWYRARATGKTYYRSLGALVRSSRGDD